jgi:hypothetical protein
MAEYEVGGERFKSKAALTERVRKILYSYPFEEELQPDDFAFMSSLLLRHTESTRKIGVGLAKMKVMPGLHKTRCFFLIRIDGTESDFSFVNCINGKAPLQDLRTAMRFAVQDQSRALRDAAFSRARVLTCPITGAVITSAEAHVDHIPPDTFERLVDRFLLEHGVDPTTVALGGDGDGEMQCYLVDDAFRTTWTEYHRAHARLRIVSVRANLSDIRRLR